MKILVVRVGRVGDIVIVTAAIRAILDKWPAAEVHVLTSPDGKRVLKGFHERLTRLIIYQRKGFKGLFGKHRVKREINKCSYDKIFCFELNPGFLKLLDQQTATVSQIGYEAQITNYAERCLKIVCDQNAIQQYWINLPITDEGKQLARQQLLERGISDDDFVVGMHPSFSALRKFTLRNQATRSQKGWPAEYFAQLATMISDYTTQRGKRVFIIMDLVPEDKALGDTIVSLCGGKAILFVPPLNFERYKALLARMNLLVSPDTGPMHVAAAVGTPLVALFAGHDPRDCGPYVPENQYRVVRAEEMPEPTNRLASIPPETVFEACKVFLP